TPMSLNRAGLSPAPRPCPLAPAPARGLGRRERHPRTKDAADVALGPESVDRAMRILDALIRALEARGGVVKNAEREGPRQTVAVIGDVSIPFSIKEGLRGTVRGARTRGEEGEGALPVATRGSPSSTH